MPLPRCLSLSAAIMALLLSSSLADAQAEAPNADAAASAAESSTANTPSVPPAQDAEPQAAPKRVPMPWEHAFVELNAMQEREEKLWQERYSLSNGGTAAVIAVGIPLSVLLIAWGSVLVIDSNSYGEGGGGAGAGMITCGILATAAVVASVWHVTHVRRKRADIDSELRALGGSRTALERMIQAGLANSPNRQTQL
jgi:hypothetical protein